MRIQSNREFVMYSLLWDVSKFVVSISQMRIWNVYDLSIVVWLKQLGQSGAGS